MPIFNIANLKVNIDFRYDFARKRAADYLSAAVGGIADFSIRAEEEDLKEFSEMFRRTDCLDQFEYVILGNKFNRKILEYNGIMLHSSCVVVDGKAYLFSADSGTGKSTHTANYLKYFGERAYILNDDKPVIRIINNELYAFGTPFSGKSSLNKNEGVKIGGICFLERGEHNSIEPISAAKALPLLMKQIIKEFDKKDLDSVIAVIDKLLTTASTYKLYCNMDIDSARVSFEGMGGEVK